MTLCAGIAVLALCLPLPGIERAELQRSGWSPREDAGGTWFESRVLASAAFKVVVSVSGKTKTTEVVFVQALQSGSQLDDAINQLCSKQRDGSPLCNSDFGTFVSEPCAGGVILAKPGTDLREAKRWFCEVLPQMKK